MRKFLKISTIAFWVSVAIMMFVTPVKAEGLQVKTGKVDLIQEGNYPSGMVELPGSVNKYNGFGTVASSLSSPASAYDAIYAGLKNLDEEIDVYSYNISYAQMLETYQSVINNSPDLFFVGGEYGCSSTDVIGTRIISVYPAYVVSSVEEANEMTAKYESAIAQAAVNVDLTQSEELVLLQLHDYLATHCEYDNDNYETNTIPLISHSAYGALVNKVAVCDGYSLALKGMLDSLTDIDSKVLTSNAMNHAWNQVELNGHYYQVDVTYDDPVIEDGYKSTYYVNHRFFLFSDSAANTFEHYEWESNGIVCDSSLYDNSSYHNASMGIASIYGGKAHMILNGAVQAYYFGYGEEAEKYSFKIQFLVNGGSYTTGPSSIYVENGKIYCTTPYANAIYVYDMASSTLNKVCDTQVAPYSIGFEGDTLYYDNNMTTYATNIKKTTVDTEHLHTEIRGAKAATCTADGYTGDKYCTDCGIKLEIGTVIKAFGHSWSAWKVVKQPTYSSEGLEEQTCSICGEKNTKTIPKKDIDALVVNLSVDTSEVAVGEQVKLVASTSDDTETFTYKFIIHNATTDVWAKIQDFSESNTYTWTAGGTGDREFYVDAKSSDGTVVRSKVVDVSVKEKEVILTPSKTAVVVGDAVTLTASVAGADDNYTYKFLIHNAATDVWAKLQDFESNSVFEWVAGSAGDREFYVDVKDGNGNVTRSKVTTIGVSAKEETTPSLTPSSSTVTVGNVLTLTAGNLGGNGKYTYKFLIHNPATDVWAKLQDFSSNNTYEWTAGSTGIREFYVDVKDENRNVVRSKVVNVDVKEGQPLSINTTASATSNKVGDTVTFTANGVGGTGNYTYKVVVYNKTTGAWGLIQDFNANNEIRWTAGSAGNREFYVDVKDNYGKVVRSKAMEVATK